MVSGMCPGQEPEESLGGEHPGRHGVRKGSYRARSADVWGRRRKAPSLA